MAVAALHRETAGPSLLRRLLPKVVGIGTLVVLGLFWQWAVDSGWISPFVAPAPSAIFKAFPGLIEDEGLFSAFLRTFIETFCSAGLAMLIGVPVGWWLHRKIWAGRAYETWVASMASAPLVLLYPLFLVIFGRNSSTIIAMSALNGLTPVVLKTKEGLDNTRRVLINVGRSFGLSQGKMFWKIMLPAAIPTISNGVQLGLIFALINVVGVEFLINFGGMGALIDDLSQRWEIPKMYGAIFFVILTSVAFYYLTERLERWLKRV
jgi:NitT/TauT family transport system permease protein